MNMFKLGALGALMVLGSSVYGMSKDTELTQSLIHSAQPIGEVFPTVQRTLPVSPSTPVRTPAGSQVSTPQSTPDSTPQRDERMAAQATYFSSLKASLVDGCKKVKSTMYSCWKKLPRWGKDTVEISAIGTSSAVLSALPYGDPVAVSIAGAAANGITNVTARHRFYQKFMADATAFGTGMLLVYLGVNPWTVNLSCIGYAAKNIFRDYAVWSGREPNLGVVCGTIKPETAERLVQPAIQQAVALIQQQIALRDDEQKETCLSRIPRGVRDGIEMGGMLGIDMLMYVYNVYAGNLYFPLLTGRAVGETWADINERHSYALRLLGSGAVAGAEKLVAYTTGIDYWPIWISALMCAYQSTLDEVEKHAGIKSAFLETFRMWPLDLQKQFIEFLIRLAAEAHAIEDGAVPMALTPVLKDIEGAAPLNLDSISLLPEGVQLPAKYIHSPSLKKDMAGIALAGAVCAATDAVMCNTRGCEMATEPLESVITAYAVGESVAGSTAHMPLYARVLGALVCGYGATIFGGTLMQKNTATSMIAPTMYLIKTLFGEYAKKTGRTNTYVEALKKLPKDCQLALTWPTTRTSAAPTAPHFEH